MKKISNIDRGILGDNGLGAKLRGGGGSSPYADVRLKVIGFNLLNGDTNQIIQAITDNDVIQSSLITSATFKIQAVTATGTVPSVVLQITQTTEGETVATKLPEQVLLPPYISAAIPVGAFGFSVVASPKSTDDGRGARGVEAQVDFSIQLPAPPPPLTYGGKVQKFNLINCANNTVVAQVTEGYTIDNNLYPSGYSFQAVTEVDGVTGNVGSLLFELFKSTTKLISRIENSAPYGISGDSGGVYSPINPKPDAGAYTLTGTCYSASNNSGIVGTPVSVNLNVTNNVVTPQPTRQVRLLKIRDSFSQQGSVTGTNKYRSPSSPRSAVEAWSEQDAAHLDIVQWAVMVSESALAYTSDDGRTFRPELLTDFLDNHHLCGNSGTRPDGTPYGPNEGLNYNGYICLDYEQEIYKDLKNSQLGDPVFENAVDEWIAIGKVARLARPKAFVGIYGAPFGAFNTGANSTANGVTSSMDPRDQMKFDRLFAATMTINGQTERVYNALFISCYLPYPQQNSGTIRTGWRSKTSIHDSLTRTMVNGLAYKLRYGTKVVSLIWGRMHSNTDVVERRQLLPPWMVYEHCKHLVSIFLDDAQIDDLLNWEPLAESSRVGLSTGDGSSPNTLPYKAPSIFWTRGLSLHNKTTNTFERWVGTGMEDGVTPDNNGNPIYPSQVNKVKYNLWQRDCFVAMYAAVTGTTPVYSGGYGPSVTSLNNHPNYTS